MHMVYGPVKCIKVSHFSVWTPLCRAVARLPKQRRQNGAFRWYLFQSPKIMYYPLSSPSAS